MLRLTGIRKDNGEKVEFSLLDIDNIFRDGEVYVSDGINEQILVMADSIEPVQTDSAAALDEVKST